MLNTILCILISIAFVYILANPKVPNSLLFLLLAPILILTHVLDAATVWGFFANNSLHLVMIISVYASLMTVSGFDEQIGETFERMTRNIHGKIARGVCLESFLCWRPCAPQSWPIPV